MKSNKMELMNKMLIAKLFLISNILYAVPEEDSLRVDGMKVIEMHEDDNNRTPIIPRVVRMQEDDDFEPNYISPNGIMACTMCAGCIGAAIGEYSLPPSWDFSTDGASSNAKIGGGVCGSAVMLLLFNRSANRKINQGCDALARLLHIKSE
jgi:uncharacterized membrane protein YeaQ/YmgE (transglycosylase-associated protein family)